MYRGQPPEWERGGRHGGGERWERKRGGILAKTPHWDLPRHAFRRPITLILCHPSLTLFSLFHHHLPLCSRLQQQLRADTVWTNGFTTPQISPRIQCALFYISITEVSQLRVRAPAAILASPSPASTGLPVPNFASLRVHRGHVHLSSSLTDCITCAHTRHQHRTTSNTSHTQQRSLFRALRVAPQQQRTPRPKRAMRTARSHAE